MELFNNNNKWSKQFVIRPHRSRRWTVPSYSSRGTNVPSHECTWQFAPPGKYLCTFFGAPKSTTQTANQLIQPFCTAYGRKSLYLTMGAHFLKVAPSHQGNGPHLIHDFLGPSEPTTQMASRWVQPFLHRWLQIVSILYNGMPLFPLQIAPSHGGIWTPI